MEEDLTHISLFTGIGGIDLAAEWPGVPRVTTGVKHRVDRLRSLGNAVVPQQIYPVLKAIADIEGGITCQWK